MTDATLTPEALESLRLSRGVALENLRFYECLYDDLEDTVERDKIGRAMAQKQSFIGAVDAILKNHDVSVPRPPSITPVSDCEDILKDIETGEHLEHEERFCSAVEACINVIDDKLTTELLDHHLRAAEIAMSAIKATSLKI